MGEGGPEAWDSDQAWAWKAELGAGPVQHDAQWPSAPQPSCAAPPHGPPFAHHCSDGAGQAPMTAGAVPPGCWQNAFALTASHVTMPTTFSSHQKSGQRDGAVLAPMKVRPLRLHAMMRLQFEGGKMVVKCATGKRVVSILSLQHPPTYSVSIAYQDALCLLPL
jgi:hypothetical protein